MIITPNKFALIIEDIVKTKRVSYMDAVILYMVEPLKLLVALTR